VKVRLSHEAKADLARIDAWWQANRPEAPLLFADEVIDLLEFLETAPEGGEMYETIEQGAVRRTLLPRTRHYAYHGIENDQVIVYAIWGTPRGEGPPLRARRR
jgi:plasmid stabilization system protein ParE